ncbi:MAG TPA: hypothetical protein VKU19_33655 [Bryobacteraceae bacterium]|nr:hypothetical protein [Bryobacteraceae bacterium]
MVDFSDENLAAWQNSSRERLNALRARYCDDPSQENRIAYLQGLRRFSELATGRKRINDRAQYGCEE